VPPFLLTRLAVVGLSVFLGSVPNLVKQDPGVHSCLKLFAVWDGSWYVRIAQQGYHTHLDRFPDYVWFPLYPLLIKGFSLLTWGHYLLAAILLSNLCLMLAMVFIFRYTELVLGSHLARRSILYLSIFPLSFVFSMAYPASLELLLVVAAFYFAETNRWGLTGGAGMLAAIAHPLGVFIALPLLLLYTRKKKCPSPKSCWRFWRRRDLKALWLALIPAGTLSYYGYLYFLTGSFWADLNGERQFGRSPSLTLEPIVNSVRLAWGTESILALVNLIFIFLYAGLLIFMLWRRKVRVEHFLLAVLFVIIPLSTGQTDGIGRYGMSAFPFFWALASWGERPLFHRAYLILAPAALLVLLVLVGTPLFVP